LALAAELEQFDKHLKALTRTHAQQLRSRFGVGPHTAAIPLSVAGDEPYRLKNKAALASLCGLNPLPTSSARRQDTD